MPAPLCLHVASHLHVVHLTLSSHFDSDSLTHLTQDPKANSHSRKTLTCIRRPPVASYMRVLPLTLKLKTR